MNNNGVEVFQICNARPIFKNNKVVASYTIQRDVSKLQQVLENNLALQRKLSENPTGPSCQPVSKPSEEAQLIGSHPSFERCLPQASQAARQNSHVTLVGKAGTGKEMLARYIHRLSPRRDRPFLAINCAAIPEALL